MTEDPNEQTPHEKVASDDGESTRREPPAQPAEADTVEVVDESAADEAADGSSASGNGADGATANRDAANDGPVKDGSAGGASTDPLEEARAEAAQYRDKLMRTAADFDNFRKRTRRELVDAERKGRDGLLRDLLPVFDNLERAVAHADGQTQDPEAGLRGLNEGIALVIRQFRDTLGRQGIERVESVGQPFDPSVHEAIQHLETDEHPPGHVAAEAQPAYREGERLVRPALVVVAKAKSASAPQAGAETEGPKDSEGPGNA